MIKGPTLIASMNSSTQFTGKIMQGAFTGVPDFAIPTVDVRDVALAHLKAYQKDGIYGDRFLIDQSTVHADDFCRILHDEFAKYGYQIPTERWALEDIIEKAKAIPKLNFLIMSYGRPMYCSNKKSIEVLGMEYRRDIL
jgi:hypothetical protein